jgi:gamma-glutamyltranspeptidase / glutathione hydrolase
MVLLAMLDFYDGKSVDQMVNDGRYHHQYLPDQVQYEPGALDDDTVKSLEKMGYKLDALDSTYGNMQAIVVNKQSGVVEAASDKRGVGAAWVDTGQVSTQGAGDSPDKKSQAR